MMGWSLTKARRWGARSGMLLGGLALVAGTSTACTSGSPFPGGPVQGPSGAAFYTPPSTLPSGGHGTLVWYRPSTLQLGSSAPAVSSWDMLYETEDSNGVADLATGEVLVPTAAWSGTGSRPVVDYAPGTQGLAQSCAPSEQLAAGTEYETANIDALLAKGYAVVVTDYQGYTAGAKPLYIDAAAEAHAVLDAATAAAQVPSVGITTSSPTAIWGYSQGGQAAVWAGQLQPSYASALDLVGVAAGGIPGDLKATADYLNGSPTAAFAGMAIIGLANQYPSAIDLATLENATGVADTTALQGECVFTALKQFEHVNLQTLTAGGQTLDQLLATPAIAQVVAAQQAGLTKIPVPLFQYHGQADEAVPLAQDLALKQAYCALGVTDQFELYPGEHITTMTQAAPDVASWLGDRFAGKPAPSDCSDTAPAPTSTATSQSGDWTVDLHDWNLSGSLTLANFGGTVQLPAGSTFNGVADLDSQQLQDGVIASTPFNANITFLGLPVVASIGLSQQGPASGTLSLDDQGQLHIAANVQETVQLPGINALGALNINLGSGCQTGSSVSFPLNFNGPISSLGNGQLTFSGTTTFPNLVNCNGYEGALNLLFPGANQKYSFTVSPPAPTAW